MTSVQPTFSAVRRSRLEFARGLLYLLLDDGNRLEVELGQPEARVPPGVPVVYLDQLHWVSLAQQLKRSERLPPAEREAASAIIHLAGEQRIVLPFAAAHLTELPRSAGQRHRDLACAILGISRGWHVRSPLLIRQAEYSASMLGLELRVDGVFTLDAGVIFTEGPPPPEPTDKLSPERATMMSRVILASAVYSAVLDGPPEMDHAMVAAARWAAAFSRLARYMREQRMNERQVRNNARAKLIADQMQDLAMAAGRANISQERFRVWLEDEFADQLGRMPYAGRLAEVIYLRLRNADDKWEAKDLNDMNFLCAAAAYADITVGEKKTIEYLRRAEHRTTPGSQLCRRLADAVEMLGARGIAL